MRSYGPRGRRGAVRRRPRARRRAPAASAVAIARVRAGAPRAAAATVRLQLDRRHRRAELREHRGVVARCPRRPRARGRRADVELLEHPRHQARLARRAGRDAVLVVGDDRVVVVDDVERDAGQEDVARDAREGVEDRAPARPPRVAARDERGVALGRLAHAGGGSSSRRASRSSASAVAPCRIARSTIPRFARASIASAASCSPSSPSSTSARHHRGGGRRARLRRVLQRVPVQGADRLEQRGAARRLGELDRGLRVRLRLQLGADDHHHPRA